MQQAPSEPSFTAAAAGPFSLATFMPRALLPALRAGPFLATASAALILAAAARLPMAAILAAAAVPAASDGASTSLAPVASPTAGAVRVLAAVLSKSYAPNGRRVASALAAAAAMGRAAASRGGPPGHLAAVLGWGHRSAGLAGAGPADPAGAPGA